jgi:hypothetical protein
MRHLCAFSSYRVNTGYYRRIVAILLRAVVYLCRESLQLHAAWLRATHAPVSRFLTTHSTARLTAPTISRTLTVLGRPLPVHPPLWPPNNLIARVAVALNDTRAKRCSAWRLVYVIDYGLGRLTCEQTRFKTSLRPIQKKKFGGHYQSLIQYWQCKHSTRYEWKFLSSKCKGDLTDN